MKKLVGAILYVLGCLPVLAQQPVAAPALRLPGHALLSIDPADTNLQDLEFLRQEIGAARVVMLGEPTHGEGNVTKAKIRLLRFLQTQMGFTTVAFESGFYELDKAQRELETGAATVPEAIGNSVFSIWTSTQEFQAILPLLGNGGLRVVGFDPQLSGAYQDDMLDELEALLKPEKGAGGIAYDYLEECFSMMGEAFIFPPANSLAIFNLQLKTARKLLEKIATGSDVQRRERAVFWLQNLRSLQALAYDYATNDPSAKDSVTFKAVDSNPRDAQMADNLLWYLRQHPQEKVICWGALPHFANKVEALRDAELKAYRPMGRAVKAALGEDAVYILGTLAGGGTHGFSGQPASVPTPAAGTLEADLLAQQVAYSFISLKHDAAEQQLTTYAFDYKPLTGAWSEVVDGFLFLPTVQPPHPATLPAAVAAEPEAPTPAVASPSYRNPAARPLEKAAATAATLTLHGTVLDDKTGQPVPFATVVLPAHGTGVVADDAGRFALPVRRGAVVQISSLGYEANVLTVGQTTVVVRLAPSAYALGDVRVSGESLNAKKIMRKVIKALPDNYEEHEYVAQVYTHTRVSNYDTLRHDAEYISQLYEPDGYRYHDGGFLALGPKAKHRFQEKHEIVPWADADNSKRELPLAMVGVIQTDNPVRTSPLFKAATLGKFILRLDSVVQQGEETLYVIAFAAKRATHRSTGTYLEKEYSGKVYVRQQDYAVLRYEALWQFDTVQYNATAHKYYGQHNQIAHLYREVFSDKRSVNTVTYEKGVNGRYHPAMSLSQGIVVGRRLGTRPFHYQTVNETYFTSQPAGTAPLPSPPSPPGMDLRLLEFWNTQFQETPYRPAFWETYQRPVPIEPEPALPATTP